MADMDIAEKNLENYDDVFADILNILFFRGKHIVHPEELTTIFASSPLKMEDGLHEEERDIIKLWKGIGFQLYFGFENQTYPDKYMPARILSYDGAVYKKQYLDIRSSKKKEDSENEEEAENQEALESQEDTENNQNQMYPVITAVLYFGDNSKWTGTRSLMDLFDLTDVPEELHKYINDYKIHIFNIADLSNETIQQFQSDFGIIADYTKKKKAKDLQNVTNKQIKHTDAVLKFAGAISKSDELKNLAGQTKGVNNMCEALDILINQGKKEAKEEGKKETRTEDILISIKMLLSLDIPKDVIIHKITKSYSIPASESEQLYVKALSNLDA